MDEKDYKDISSSKLKTLLANPARYRANPLACHVL